MSITEIELSPLSVLADLRCAEQSLASLSNAKSEALAGIILESEQIQARMKEVSAPFDLQLKELNEGVAVLKGQLQDLMIASRDATGNKSITDGTVTVTVAQRRTLKVANAIEATGFILRNAGPDALPRLLSPSSDATKFIESLVGKEDDVATKAPGWTVAVTDYLTFKEASK